MKEIPLSKGRVAIVDDEDYEWLMHWKWHTGSYGYAVRSTHSSRAGGKPRSTQKIHMHREIAGTPEGKYTDHINGNRLDNRRANLRVCTNTENQRNRDRQRNNASGYKGVTLHSGGKWQAQIRGAGRKWRYLGLFTTPEEAHAAYVSAARELHGDFANTGS